MIEKLHADHIDTSGAYNQKFMVVKELLEAGLLNDIPKEFCKNDEIVTDANEEAQWHMSVEHADHVDETGRYVKAYEEKYGEQSLTIQSVQNNAENSWKSFLQNIIAEEKSKLKI